MMRLPSRSAWTLAVLGVLFGACGDDDDPVAGNSPCDDANICLGLTLKPDAMTYDVYYDSILDRTFHTLGWIGLPAALRDYGPGRRILVFVTFDPPIEVRYDHATQRFDFIAGEGGTVSQFAYPTPSANSLEWTSIDASAFCWGGTATVFGVSVPFEALVTGEKLRSVSFDVTIPETYDGGDPMSAGQVEPISIALLANTAGNAQGNPPVWPEDHPLVVDFGETTWSSDLELYSEWPVGR